MLLLVGALGYLLLGCLVLALLARYQPSLWPDPTEVLGLAQLMFWPVVVGLWLLFRLPAPVANGSSEIPTDRQVAVGTAGLAAGDLRPWGWVTVGAQRLEARAQQGFIGAGKRVEIVAHDGRRLVVRPLA